MGEVVIAVGGETLRPVSISIKPGAGKAARTFEAKLAGNRGDVQRWCGAFANSPACTITEDGKTAFTGHLEVYSPSFAADSYEMSISGRSKTGDLVDSSHNHKKGEFKKKTPKSIISEIAKEHSVSIEGQGGEKPREMFRLNPGETIFSALDRLAKRDGFNFTDTPEGNLKLFDKPTETHSGQLIEGVHFLTGSAKFDSSKRFKTTQVKGQAPVDHGPDNLEIDVESTDSGGARARRKVIIAPEFLRKQDAKERAKHHRDRSAGKGVTCEFTVPGWRDQGGEFWQPGKKIYVESPLLGLSQEMMVESVTLKQGERDGTTSDLSFVDPRAYGGKGGKGGKSGKQFDLKGAGGDDE